ncbi:MAG TPA: PEP-CTERM sorting domain-containing protein [Kiritimatiellia bacterium]|nr:PEP-CTERM sorting domain-containing protein [Kiritimatiellia bacterium]
MRKLAACAIGALITAGAAQADLLVSFDFAGAAGNEVTSNANFVAAGISGPVTISRGGGIAAAANGDRFNANGWGETSAANALASGDYFEWTITPDTGFFLSITQIAFQVQRSNTGASNLVLRTSVDSYTANLNTLNNFIGNSATVTTLFDSGGVSALQNVGGAITFRVIGWTGASGGSMGFEGPGNDIQIWGAAVVPEPASMALMTMGVGVVALMRRRLRL